MGKWIFLLCLLGTQHVFADFIVKYRSGKVVTSKIDPTTLSALATSDSDDQIEYVEEDRYLQLHSSPNDPLYSQQWAMVNYLNDSFEMAKQEVSGAQTITVAVVDTGRTSHSDLNAVYVQGHDFISDSTNSQDGDGRDSDPTDTGDYARFGSNCGSMSSSSWHGTHVSGIVAAQTNNSVGVAGAGTNIQIQPIRVLGQCGGKTSDIADAIRWAAGGSVSGVGTNQSPAKVINLSLGGRGSCSQYMQEAVNFANSRGALVVVSSGNDGANVDSLEYTPANCRGVFRVGAVNTYRGESTYSNYGSIIDISAPGDIIYSTVNGGYTTASSESYKTMSGTSMSAGFISATAAMIFSINPNLYVDQVKDIMVRTAQSVYCRNINCSKGTVDAYEAVLEARREVPDASFEYQDTVLSGGTSNVESRVQVTNGGGGACGTIEDVNKAHRNYPGALFVLLAVFFVHRFVTRMRLKHS
ncbi:S8 family peptidase [Bacteriovorax sp. DB6_IX]|uniref:S8 family peptidase n=1 Tax=Bacteriovorax sp. DB6_IX TaxID=1353530 RepID=UPI0006A6B435|nr:S8 family peptidase [Bacteriovorax sp. DB6_IX]